MVVVCWGLQMPKNFARPLAAAVIMLLCAGSALADGLAPPHLTRQALYDGAQAAYDAGDWDGAISGFNQALVGAKSSSRTTGVIRGRLASALLRRGRLAAAQAAAVQAITEIRQGAAGPDADLADAYLTLGDALRFELDFDPAIAAYRQVLALATGPAAPAQMLSADIGMILSSTVTQPELAAQIADGLIANQPTFMALPAADRALIFTLRARAELNRGDSRKALNFEDKALALSGNLTSSHINLRQVTVREDAGLIYAVRHDEEGMREYFARAGAGHLPSEDWFSGAKTELPVCGPEVSPDDTAVVEFAIGEDGRTLGAAPIYASRPGQMGVVFARAVRDWRWRAETVAKLEPFWRASIRVQLRCVTTPPAIELSEPFAAATNNWLAANGLDPHLGEAGSAATDASAANSRGGDLGRIAQLILKAKSHYSTAQTRIEAGRALDLLLEKAGAPPEMRAYMWVASLTDNQRAPGRAAEGGGRAQALAVMATRLPAGERSAAWIRTEQAISLETNGDFVGARAPLERVAELPTSRLPSDDPIRRVAVLHLSLVDRATGHEDAARARLTTAGLTGDQCSLLDVRPLPRNTAVTSDDFPREAERWRFEGWVREAFDIAPDGAVTKVRTVVAYPPFVFGPATESTVKSFRYLPPTLGDKVLGCAGASLNFRYGLP